MPWFGMTFGLHHVNARLGRLLHFWNRRRGFFGLAPFAEGGFELLQHLRLLEVARDDQNGVVGAPVFLVPGDQVVAGDAVDRRLGRLGGDRRVFAVDQLLVNPRGDLRDILVAVADPGQSRSLSRLSLSSGKAGFVKNVHPDLQAFVEVADVDGQVSWPSRCRPGNPFAR